MNRNTHCFHELQSTNKSGSHVFCNLLVFWRLANTKQHTLVHSTNWKDDTGRLTFTHIEAIMYEAIIMEGTQCRDSRTF